jgi:hypothetical protein
MNAFIEVVSYLNELDRLGYKGAMRSIHALVQAKTAVNTHGYCALFAWLY